MRKIISRLVAALVLLVPFIVVVIPTAHAAVDPDSYVVMQFRDDIDPISGNYLYKVVGSKIGRAHV